MAGVGSWGSRPTLAPWRSVHRGGGDWCSFAAPSPSSATPCDTAATPCLCLPLSQPGGSQERRGRCDPLRPRRFRVNAVAASAANAGVSARGLLHVRPLCGRPVNRRRRRELPVDKVPSLLLRDFRASIVPPFGQKSCSNLGTEPHFDLVLATSALFSTSRESGRRPGAEFGRYRN